MHTSCFPGSNAANSTAHAFIFHYYSGLFSWFRNLNLIEFRPAPSITLMSTVTEVCPKSVQLCVCVFGVERFGAWLCVVYPLCALRRGKR